MASSLITAVDVGTSTVKVAVAENKGGHPSLCYVAKEQSAGTRKGAIVELQDASRAVSRMFTEVRKFSKAALKNVYLVISTAQAKAQTSRGIVAVSRADAEIYEDDVERVVKASQAVNLLPNRTVLHNITKEFIVDGVGDIADPLGLSGSRLEVVSLIIDAFTPHIKSLMRVVELAGCHVKGLVWSPLVASRAALSRSQKELGVVLVDIGGGTTGFTVYEENKLLGVAKFPVGAGNISNDIAVGLRIPVSAADDLKLNYGYAIAREVSSKETIELKKFVPGAKGVVSRRFIAEIIESRLAEVLGFVQNELDVIGRSGKLPGGAVLVGGGAKLPGLTELVKQELKLSSQIGSTVGEFARDKEFSEYLEDPEFAAVMGSVLWGVEEEGWGTERGFRGFKFDLKGLIRYFLP
jgi:cell division protein FtsA